MPPYDIVSLDEATAMTSHISKRYLLLGNGFSIALKPDIFSYGSLLDNADFSNAPGVRALFEALSTKDFEIVIRHLLDAARVVQVYRQDLAGLIDSSRSDATKIKEV